MSTADSTKKQFAIQQIVMHNTEFIRHSVEGLKQTEWKPNAKLEVNTRHKNLSNDEHEMTLIFALHVSLEETNIFTVKYEQTGIFLLKHLTSEEEKLTLNVTCLQLLYPYAAEGINNLIYRAGYPPLYLAPIDFNQMHQQREQQKIASHDAVQMN